MPRTRSIKFVEKPPNSYVLPFLGRLWPGDTDAIRLPLYTIAQLRPFDPSLFDQFLHGCSKDP